MLNAIIRRENKHLTSSPSLTTPTSINNTTLSSGSNSKISQISGKNIKSSSLIQKQTDQHNDGQDISSSTDSPTNDESVSYDQSTIEAPDLSAPVPHTSGRINIPSPKSTSIESSDAQTFNLAVAGDAGIVFCPGFQRINTIRSRLGISTNQPVRVNNRSNNLSQFPALSSTLHNVETQYSPTLLPAAPLPAATIAEATLSSSSSSSSSSSPNSDAVTSASLLTSPSSHQHTIQFEKGVLKIVNTPEIQRAAGIPLGKQSSVVAPIVSTVTSTKEALLKKFHLPAWLSRTQQSNLTNDNPTNEEVYIAAHQQMREERLTNEDISTSAEHVTDSSTSVSTAPVSTSVSESEAVVPGSNSNFPTNSSLSQTNHLNPLPSIVPNLSISSSSFFKSLFPASIWSSLTHFFSPHTDSLEQQQQEFSKSDSDVINVVPYYKTLKRIVIIGIHGWSVLGGAWGDPGIVISTRFCWYTQQSLIHYLSSRGINEDDIDICCIPLQGHGKVDVRTELYIKQQLPLYKEKIYKADHILIAAHSQGCLVAVAILTQLLSSSSLLSLTLDPSHITLILLAGLHQGPFPDTISDQFASTKELFIYSSLENEKSQQHIQSLLQFLVSGVKIVCIGSVHDAVVPLYSSVATILPSSPNLLRAFYVDYVHYQPDFLYALLSLTFFISNTSTSSNIYTDLLSIISGFTRGSLYDAQGGAHSALHRLKDVWALGVEFAMSGSGKVSRNYQDCSNSNINIKNAINDNSSKSAVKSSVNYDKFHSHSFAMWSHQFTDQFTLSKFNKYLLFVRVKELLDIVRDNKLLIWEEEYSRLCELYRDWIPKNNRLKSMKDTLVGLFEISKGTSTNENPTPNLKSKL